MNIKNLALLSGVACATVLATYAWATSQDESEVKEEAATEQTESAEPAPLCIPMAEAKEAAAGAETDEAKAEDSTDEAKAEESTDEAKSEDGDAEVAALPICDEDGNPPAPEGEKETGEEAESAEKATDEAAKTE